MTNDQRPMKATGQPRRFSLLLWSLVVSSLVIGSLVIGHFLLWSFVPKAVPPDIALEDADPDLVSAVEEARRRVRQQPYSAERWGDLGKLLRGAGLVEDAPAYFAQAERLAPDDPRWPYLRGESLLLRDADAALPPLRRAAALWGRRDKVENVAPWLRLGEALLAAGDYAEAEENLRRAAQAAPKDPLVLLNLGLLACARDDLVASKRYLDRCRNSPLTRQRACAGLAVVCRRLGDNRAAAEFSAKAAELPPDPGWRDPFVAECLQGAVGANARFRRAEQAEARGRYRDAALLLEELANHTADARAYVGLGRNLARLGDGRRAERALREALRLTPGNVQAHYHLAQLEWSRAEQARRQKDRQAEEQALRQAVASARQALAGKPDHGLARALLGRCLARLGQRTEALTELREAVKGHPDLADPYLHLGEVLAEDGQPDEARRCLEQALRLARPDDPRPRAALERLRSGKSGD
jgi:tetratricopeptide (TPR) repeat protein